jgi:hypothetical protein
MPVQACRKDSRPGYRYGSSGKCYTYPAGNASKRKAAKQKAIDQGLAIERNRGGKFESSSD